VHTVAHAVARFVEFNLRRIQVSAGIVEIIVIPGPFGCGRMVGAALMVAGIALISYF
jgi:hypothetical protein